MDYDRITGFFIRQMSEKAQEVFWEIKTCHRYAVRLHPFVCAHHVDHICRAVHRPDGRRDRKKRRVVIALLIAVFDILPVLGTGGIMIPWAAITAIQGRVQARAGAVRGIYRGHDHPNIIRQDRGRQLACIRWRRLRVCSSAHSCSAWSACSGSRLACRCYATSMSRGRSKYSNRLCRKHAPQKNDRPRAVISLRCGQREVDGAGALPSVRV